MKTQSPVTVSDLSRAIAQLLHEGFPSVWVRGEVASLTRASSGHWYFGLKDANAYVKCVMFRHRAAAVSFDPKGGEAVEVLASLTLYEPRGDLQLQVDRMRLAGVGDLYEAFVRLKNKFLAEGLFALERKKPIPKWVRCVGVVTSLQAAALQDVLSTFQRRAPSVRLKIFPSPVQGLEAPGRLMAALLLADECPDLDVVILVRGGGSLEDLWAFNDESLARVIARMSHPVIVGVGHETDVTIADFVADLRAPTPTAAAELAVRPDLEWLRDLNALAQSFAHRIRARLDFELMRLDRLRFSMKSPKVRLLETKHRLALLRFRMRPPSFSQPRDGLHRRSDRLKATWQEQLGRSRQSLALLEARLEALAPERVLERGYAVVFDVHGAVVSAAHGTAPGEHLRVQFSDESLEVEVLKTQRLAHSDKLSSAASSGPSR